MAGMKIETLAHGRYLIRAARMASGKARAMAYLQPPTRRKGQVAEVEAGSTAEAMAALRQLLDDRDGLASRDRRVCEVNNVPVPSAAAFREALADMVTTPRENAMLDAHARAGAAGLSSQKIAEAGGYRTAAAANSQYGGLARRFADHLAIGPLPRTPDGQADLATSAIAHEGTPDQGAFVWVMHAELRDALASLGRA